MALSVSIVIPTWNGRPLLERFLPSVVAAAERYVRHHAASVEIVVVDDGSADGTADWCATTGARTAVPIRVVRTETNRGFGAAANLGISESAGSLVWLLNNDVEVSDAAIEHLARPFETAAPTLFAVHSQMVDLASGDVVGTGKFGGFARGFLRVHRSFVPRPGAAGPFWSMFATGGSAMFRRTTFLELGGFDLLFAPFYMEDVELSYRAWKRGWSVQFEPRSVVRHQFSSTIAPLAGRRIERISHRNRLVFHWIHLHDAPYFRRHLLWLAILLLTSPLTLKWRFLQGFGDAVRTISSVRARRTVERARAKRSDREVLRIFEAMNAAGTVQPYDDKCEVAGLSG